ncbi:DUF1573 domain-containing protein [Mariniblastus sp.]|nr:DUF1573 domain-containing protein [Mariniblastus sp.]
MKLSLITLSLTMLLALVQFCQPACGQHWSANLFTERSHDFGDVLVGEKAEHQFEIVNNFDFPISITRVSKSAGPFKASATKDTIAPGETAEIVCEILTQPGALGVKTATVTVALLGKEHAEYQLLLKAKVIASTKFDRSTIKFPDVKLGQKATVDLKLSVSKAIHQRLVDVRSTYRNISVRNVAAKDTGDTIEYDLKISLLETAPVGIVNNNLYFDLQPRDESQKSKYNNCRSLPFTGNVISPLK